jgi:hypothetical protein
VLHVGPGVGDEDVERGEASAAYVGEHAGDILGPRRVGLEQDRFGAALAEQARGLLGGVAVLEVVHPDPADAAVGELERDAAADAARRTGDARGACRDGETGHGTPSPRRSHVVEPRCGSRRSPRRHKAAPPTLERSTRATAAAVSITR